MNPDGTGEPPQRAWKGLDTSQMPVFLGYDQIERMIAALLDDAAAWHPDGVVGIARGGLVPAAMAAGILALPLSMVAHDATSGTTTWIGPPSSGHRILLVDDCCSSGNTLHRTRASLTEAGYECLTLVVVHDPDTARHLPDLSHPMRALFRLPWERGEATPTGRAAKLSRTRNDLAAEAPFVALGFDEALLPEVAAGHKLRRLPSDRAVLICSLADAERARIAAVLATTPYRDLPLECRPETTAPDQSAIALYKAATATRWGCTHFIECDSGLAIRIAAEAAHLLVTWWPAGSARGWIIGAAAQSQAAATKPCDSAVTLAVSHTSVLQPPPMRDYPTVPAMAEGRHSVEQPAYPANSISRGTASPRPASLGSASLGSSPAVPNGSAPNGSAIELAVLDAPVLVRGVLTMVLLHVAEAGAFDPVWSDQIHADWARELQRSHPAMPIERLRHRRVEMDRAFPVANVIASRDMQDEVLAHCTTPAERKSAHVLATALSARAAVIITDTSFCLSEVMSKLWHDTAVLSPDAWCLELLDRHEAAVLEGGRTHRGKNPVDTWLALLRAPQVGLTATADRLASLREKL